MMRKTTRDAPILHTRIQTSGQDQHPPTPEKHKGLGDKCRRDAMRRLPITSPDGSPAITNTRSSSGSASPAGPLENGAPNRKCFCNSILRLHPNPISNNESRMGWSLPRHMRTPFTATPLHFPFSSRQPALPNCTSKGGSQCERVSLNRGTRREEKTISHCSSVHLTM